MAPDASGWEVAAAALLSTALGQWLRKPLKGILQRRVGYRAGAALARLAHMVARSAVRRLRGH